MNAIVTATPVPTGTASVVSASNILAFIFGLFVATVYFKVRDLLQELLAQPARTSPTGKNVAIQGPVTYLFKNARSEFKPLRSEYLWGCWRDGVKDVWTQHEHIPPWCRNDPWVPDGEL